MLFLLSPAKSLDYESPLPPGMARRATTPAFTTTAAELIQRLLPLAHQDVAGLMDLSDDLAALNVARYAAWSAQANARNSRPAALAFNGDVYLGLQAGTLDAAAWTWAQSHVVILSGLYGALRPLDRLQPYRLEMGTALATERGRDLYAWWGDTVAEYLNARQPGGQSLNARQAGARTPILVNLASQEYFKVADRPALQGRVVDCVFEDFKSGPDGQGGQYKIISFFAKRARGMMCRWAIDNRIGAVKALREFDVGGYAFDRRASAADRLVFRRKLDTV